MKTYKSKKILKADDLYGLQDSFCCSGIPFQYEMTAGEIQWLNFIRGKYAIADWIDNRLNGKVLTFDDSQQLSEILESDGIPNKAVMLSDDSALQRLFFWLS